MTDGKLRILHLEDDLNDAELIRAKLAAGGLDCEIRLVRDRAGFLEAVRTGGFDLIISDFSIPSFSGREALDLAREAAPGVPFLFVSGTIGEDRAVEALKDGATDYVLKTNLKRLVPAVARAREEARQKDARRKAEEALRLTEAQLRQSQKLEAVGRLAGGVAHDFNNILTAIMSYGDFLRKEIAPGDPKRADLEEIIAASERAARLTRQLLAFSRKQPLEPRPVELNAVVADMEKLLRRLIGENVALRTRLAPDLWKVFADPGQLEQVILNLAVNARDAMPSGGTLEIETVNTAADAEFARLHPPLKPGEYASLRVTDTGSGISPETRARLFEPFFTTKEAGKGTGLGLSTVYGIVKQSGGSILVESGAGRGASFCVYLPRTTAAARTQAAPPAARPAARSSGSVLLVEDDESIRKMARRVLEQDGYAITAASTAEEALAMAAAAPPPDLLLTDLVLPGKDGVELAGELFARHGLRRVLFTSGYPDIQADSACPPEMLCRFIQKPFSPDELLRKLRETLSAEGE